MKTHIEEKQKANQEKASKDTGDYVLVSDKDVSKNKPVTLDELNLLDLTRDRTKGEFSMQFGSEFYGVFPPSGDSSDKSKRTEEQIRADVAHGLLTEAEGK